MHRLIQSRRVCPSSHFRPDDTARVALHTNSPRKTLAATCSVKPGRMPRCALSAALKLAPHHLQLLLGLDGKFQMRNAT